MRDYFDKLFLEGQGNYSVVTKAVDVGMTVEDNIKLTAPFYIDEFRKVLYQMHPDKAPGLDGLNPAFFLQILGYLWSGYF